MIDELDKRFCRSVFPSGRANGSESINDVLPTYLSWLDSEMQRYVLNPQVCQTYWECLTRLQSLMGLPLTDFKPPLDNS